MSPNDKRLKNLRPRHSLSKDEAVKMGSLGGKRSGQVRKEKKKMSEIYGDFLAEEFNIAMDGIEKQVSGAQYCNLVMKKILKRSDSAAVSLLKEFREALEGNRLALTDADGGPFGIYKMTFDQAKERLDALRSEGTDAQ